MIRIHFNKNQGRHGLRGNFLKKGSVNVLGASFWWLYMGIYYTGFGGEIADTTKGRTHVLSTEAFWGR